MTDNLKLADDLDRIANHISRTLYHAGHAIQKAYTFPSGGKITHDDYDRLREIAKELRGEEGQAAHELGRRTMPWA